MRNDYTIEPRQPRSGRRSPTRVRPWRWLEFFLLFAFAICLLVGTTALYLLWGAAEQTEPTISDNPFQTLQTQQIVPQLALRHLAGDPANGLVLQAIQAKQLATAETILLFDTQIPATGRAALWLQLAQAYQAMGEQNSATHATQVVQMLATLDWQLVPIERAQLLVQTTNLFVQGQQSQAAADSANQAMTIAAQTPDWLPAQRSQIFNTLQPIVAQLENTTVQRRLADFAQNPFLTPSGVVLTATLFSQFALSQPNLAPDLVAAIETRKKVAQLLADRLLFTGGVDAEPEKQALLAALLAEDQARSTALQQVMQGGNLSLEQQFNLLLQQWEWLAIKLRVTLGGYGLSLVPDWENRLPQIRQEMSLTIVNLVTVMEGLSQAQPTPTQQTALHLDTLLWQLRQAELGLYHAPPLNDLREQLRLGQATLEQSGLPLSLPVVYTAEGGKDGYAIQTK